MKRHVFQLYVAGQTPNSLRAQSNLEALCRRYLADRYQIEIIDVFRDGKRALENQIIATPAVLRLKPGPKVVLFGDLSDEKRVREILAPSEAEEASRGGDSD